MYTVIQYKGIIIIKKNMGRDSHKGQSQSTSHLLPLFPTILSGIYKKWNYIKNETICHIKNRYDKMSGKIGVILWCF